MAKVEEHLHQAKHNFLFLQSINKNTSNSTDWQVTVCFYTALHLINAYLANSNLHYRTHGDVKNAINPYRDLSSTKLPEDEYHAYTALQILSRRSRYLVQINNKGEIASETAAFTYDKHLARAIRHLDRLFSYYCQKYKTSIEPIDIFCSELKSGDKLSFFRLKK